MAFIDDILQYKNQMYRLALRITLNSQEAEDVVQDVMIKAWRMNEAGTLVLSEAADKDQQTNKLEAYLIRMTRNLAIDRQRLKVNQTEDIDGVDVMNVNDNANVNMERQEKVDQVRALMQQMPEKQRTVMQLRDFEGYSYKEIEDIMQISEDQVKVNLFRARKFIKDKFQEEK